MRCVQNRPSNQLWKKITFAESCLWNPPKSANKVEIFWKVKIMEWNPKWWQYCPLTIAKSFDKKLHLYMFWFARLITFLIWIKERGLSVYSEGASVYLSRETFLLLHNILICHRKRSPSPRWKNSSRTFSSVQDLSAEIENLSSV